MSEGKVIVNGVPVEGRSIGFDENGFYVQNSSGEKVRESNPKKEEKQNDVTVETYKVPIKVTKKKKIWPYIVGGVSVVVLGSVLYFVLRKEEN